VKTREKLSIQRVSSGFFCGGEREEDGTTLYSDNGRKRLWTGAVYTIM